MPHANNAGVRIHYEVEGAGLPRPEIYNPGLLLRHQLMRLEIEWRQAELGQQPAAIAGQVATGGGDGVVTNIEVVRFRLPDNGRDRPVTDEVFPDSDAILDAVEGRAPRIPAELPLVIEGEAQGAASRRSSRSRYRVSGCIYLVGDHDPRAARPRGADQIPILHTPKLGQAAGVRTFACRCPEGRPLSARTLCA